jgi:aminoglycoside phosphotransferase (APT) family kinase protein
VARLAPDAADVPVFPSYNLEAQFRVMRLVGERSTVAVPPARWFEPDPSHIGTPFLVMERVEGRVPPDVMPYNFGSWVSEATSEERRELQETSLRVLVDLHAIDLSDGAFAFLAPNTIGETPLRRHVAHWRDFYEWMRDGRTFPLIEKAFDWLDAHWPEEEGSPVVSWGDSRIGNMIFDGFRPVAVLDWEMASIAPRGVDVGWMIFLHTFFEDIAGQMNLPGLPDFMRSDDAWAFYEQQSGVAVSAAQQRFYAVYAALRHALVMARVHARRAHFGEAVWPDDPDDAIMHRALLTRMLGGSAAVET